MNPVDVLDGLGSIEYSADPDIVRETAGWRFEIRVPLHVQAGGLFTGSRRDYRELSKIDVYRGVTPAYHGSWCFEQVFESPDKRLVLSEYDRRKVLRTLVSQEMVDAVLDAREARRAARLAMRRARWGRGNGHWHLVGRGGALRQHCSECGRPLPADFDVHTAGGWDYRCICGRVYHGNPE